MSSKRLKLLLIRGLGHSGTTMLDLALGRIHRSSAWVRRREFWRRQSRGTSIAGPVNFVVLTGLSGFAPVGSLRRSAQSGALSLSGFACTTKCRCRRKCCGC